MALLGLGILLILTGMSIFNLHSGFVWMSGEGIANFFVCNNQKLPDPETGAIRIDPEVCFSDYFTAHMLPRTMMVLGLQAAGAVMILLGLTQKKLGIATNKPSTQRT
jgi:hypothetical protein